MTFKWLASILATVGLSQPVVAEKKVHTLDPKSIMFSVPTISNDLASLEPVVEPPLNSEPQMHEDDWCQVEFFRESYLPELQRMLREYKSFESNNREITTIQGKDYPVWRNTYVRKVAREALISGRQPLSQLVRLVGGESGPATAIFSSSGWSGRVKDGFTLKIGRGVDLYGYLSGDAIPVLGASIGADADEQALVRAFATLHDAHGLVLVDWKSQFILVGTDAEGMVMSWQP
jgi:hypothetical protein